MKNIETASGFSIEIDENVLDDFDTFEMLCKIDGGDYRPLSDVLVRLLGADGFMRLREHVKTESGRVPITALLAEMGEIVALMGKK